MQVDGIGGTMEFPFPMNFRAEVGEPESYGPGRHLVLNDWVEVFSVTQMKFFKDVVAKFQIEVR
jgi:hypothetical protein